MTEFVLDSSAVVTWILQEPRWQAIDTLLMQPTAEPKLPGPGLTEVIHVARRKHNVSSPAQIRRTLLAQGIAVVHPTEDDLVRAAELLELSDAHPGPVHRATGRPGSLSRGDASILAIAERHDWPVITRDAHWSWFAGQRLTKARVSDF